ncbi:LAGLIDADG family homing endonuclease [Candidatus Bathyarchaeota archaeon]|nr:LAGLIDADG family homing endonuclease [Candidatus Bathyarchaeota archaeon]
MENVYTEMLAWTLNEQAKYLRGFADGEGGPRFYRWRHERKGHHVPGDPHVRAIAISNSDRRLLNTVQQMFKNLEIRCRIYLDVRKGERKATMDSWVLKILDKESITKFAELIGFSDPKKMDILQQIIASYR